MGVILFTPLLISLYAILLDIFVLLSVRFLLGFVFVLFVFMLLVFMLVCMRLAIFHAFMASLPAMFARVSL